MCLVKKVFKLSIVPYQTEIIALQKYIAAVHLHSDEKVYLKISQNFQENTCAGVFFKQSSDEGLKKNSSREKSTDCSQYYDQLLERCFLFNLSFLNKVEEQQNTCFRSSHQRCSIIKGVPRNFAKFTGKHLCQGLFFNKVAGLSLFYRTPANECFWCFNCYTLKIKIFFKRFKRFKVWLSWFGFCTEERKLIFS